MILKQISLRGWKCFSEPLQVGPLSEGINIIHAPNGSGKSTLFEALRRGFLDSYRVSGDESNELRPWNLDLTPCLEIEFSEDGDNYRLRKQFLDKPSAELFLLSGGEFKPIAEGEAVHERLTQLLRATPSSRGLSREANWGLTQVLWAAQGKLHLSSLSSELVTVVRDSLGSQYLGEQGALLEREIGKRYQEFFTPTGRFRGGSEAPPFVKATAERRKRADELAVLQTNYAEYEQALVDLENVRIGRIKAEERTLELKTQLSSERAQMTEFVAVRAELEKLTAEAKASELEFKEKQTRLNRRNELREAVSEKQMRLTALVTELTNTEAEIRTAESNLEARETALEQFGKFDQAFQGQTLELSKATEFVRINSTLERLSGTNSKHDETSTDVVVTLAAETDLSLWILEGGEKHRRQTVAPGESLKLTGSAHVEVELEGIGRVSAQVSNPATREFEVELRNNRKQILTEYPSWANSPPDLELLKRHHAEEKEKISAGKSMSQRAWQEQVQIVSALHTHLTTTKNARVELTTLLESLGRELQQREQAFPSDAEFQAELDRLALRWHSKTTLLDQAREKLQTYPRDQVERVSALEAALQNEQAAERRLFAEEKRKEALLHAISDSGIYSRIAELEEECARLTGIIGEGEARANALRLLYETLGSCSKEALQEVMKPVEELTVRVLEQIGFRHGVGLRLAENLSPLTVRSNDLNHVTVNQLSVGEQEQVHFAVRLALAHVLAAKSRQLVVLDDVLVYTDAYRLSKVLEVLRWAATNVQIVILSCHPEKYASLTEAQFIDLLALARNKPAVPLAAQL